MQEFIKSHLEADIQPQSAAIIIKLPKYELKTFPAYVDVVITKVMAF